MQTLDIVANVVQQDQCLQNSRKASPTNTATFEAYTGAVARAVGLPDNYARNKNTRALLYTLTQIVIETLNVTIEGAAE